MLSSNHKWDDNPVTRDNRLLCLWLWQNGIAMTSLWNQYYIMFATVADLWYHWYRSMADCVCHAPSIFQWHYKLCMPCSINFSMTLQTEILSIETSDFFKQMIILKSFNFMLDKEDIKPSLKILCLLCLQGFQVSRYLGIRVKIINWECFPKQCRPRSDHGLHCSVSHPWVKFPNH